MNLLSNSDGNFTAINLFEEEKLTFTTPRHILISDLSLVESL